jgi:tRNA(Ile)-lysidine synthase
MMQLPRGTYVVGVSGGVDSVVLLRMLVNGQPGNRYIVAHFDHGIRGEDSEHDAELVSQLAAKYNLELESERASLGPDTSEAAARTARYDFLRRCREKWQADAIILAHHQDDVLETAIINLIRGTGWRGLSSLRSHPKLIRPLLGHTKKEIYEYARQHKLQWREDSTNTDPRYLRNYVRLRIVPRFNEENRRAILELSKRQTAVERQIAQELRLLLENNLYQEDGRLSIGRYFLIMCPKHVALECLQATVQKAAGYRLQRPQAELALVFAKAAHPGKRWFPTEGLSLRVNRDQLFVEVQEPIPEPLSG